MMLLTSPLILFMMMIIITTPLILIMITHTIRESEETERKTNEDIEEKRREISEISSDLAAARLRFEK